MNKLKSLLLIFSTLLFTTMAFATDNSHAEGEKLYKSICAACHSMAAGGMDMDKRIAPPMAGVKKHYLDAYPDEASFVEAVSSWIEKQDESKSLMPGAIQKFRIMPPLSVPKEDAKKIAAYLYSGNIEMPAKLDEHMKEMHQKMGMEKQHQAGHEMSQQHMQMMGKMPQKPQMPVMAQKPPINHANKARMQMGQMINRIKQGMKNRQGMNAFMMKQLQLSNEQKQKMQNLIQQKKMILQPLYKRLQEIKQRIRQLDATNQDYKQQVFALAEQKAKLVYRMTIEKGEKRWQIESILTPQQRAKFKQLRQKRFNQWQQH